MYNPHHCKSSFLKNKAEFFQYKRNTCLLQKIYELQGKKTRKTTTVNILEISSQFLHFPMRNPREVLIIAEFKLYVQFYIMLFSLDIII